MTGQQQKTLLILSFVLTLGIFGCGKSSDDKESQAGEFTPPANPVPTEKTPATVKKQIDTAANAVKENLDDCRENLSSPNDTLSSLENARQGKVAGGCISNALKALAWLGKLQEDDYLRAQELRRFIRALVNWIHRLRQQQQEGPPVLIAAFMRVHEGSHIVGGLPCPSNTESAGGFADCGGGKCNGNQVLCKLRTPMDAYSQVVLDVLVTQEGLHKVGGPGCPEGYRPRGSIADCGGGNCNGNQLLCLRSAPM